MQSPSPLSATVTPDAPAAVVSLFDSPPRRLEVGHSELAYWRIGQGPDLVLIHGWPLHAATFRRLLPALSRHFTCHLLDLPGAGKSLSAADAPIDMRAHAHALKRALDQLGLTRFALLGHDSGGLIARMLCAQDPRVTCLVLSGTELSRHRSWLVQLLVLAARLPAGATLLRWALGFPFVQRSALGFGGCLADLNHLQSDFRELFIRPMIASPHGARRALRHLRSWDWRWVDDLPALHAQIAVPTQLIWGSKDGLFPIQRARHMSSEFRLPACFIEIPGGKAFLHEDMPAQYVAASLPFLTRHAGGGQ